MTRCTIRVKAFRLAVGVALLLAASACAPARDPRQTVRDGLFYDGLAAFHEGFHKEAAERWERAARFGDIDAARNLGHLYRKGLGVEQDSHIALAWYQVAADAGLASAQYNLGMLLLNGAPHLPPDRAAGLPWLTRAAEAGLKPARAELERLASEAPPAPPAASPPPQPPPAAEAAAPPAAADPPVTVRRQVGSYRTRWEAERDIKRLGRPGVEFEIRESDLKDRGLWYRLMMRGDEETVDSYCREAEARKLGCWPGKK